MSVPDKNRTVLITGGTGGIGTAISDRLINSHYKVILTDQVKKNDSSAPFFKCDIRNPHQIDEFYNWVSKDFGIPNVLILNAGIGLKEKLTEGDPEKWQEVFEVNLMGTLRIIRAFTPQMLERKTGQIIFISSVSANQPHPYGGIYSASKTALNVIAETLRLECTPHLQITTICPGSVETEFFKNQLAGASEEDRELPKINPQQIADDVLYCIRQSANRTINKIITRPIGQLF